MHDLVSFIYAGVFCLMVFAGFVFLVASAKTRAWQRQQHSFEQLQKDRLYAQRMLNKIIVGTHASHHPVIRR